MQIRWQSLNRVAERQGTSVRYLSIGLVALIWSAAWHEPVAKATPQAGHTQQTTPQTEKAKPGTAQPEGAPSLPALPNRSSVSLPQALMGHWVTEDGKFHMFYGPDGFISVFAGKPAVGTYTLEEINEDEKRLRVRIRPLHLRILTFAADKNSFVDVIEFNGIKLKDEDAFHWRYVDARQQPTAELIESTKGDKLLIDAVSVEEAPGYEFMLGDSSTKTFYWRGCPDYEKVAPPKRVYFKTRADAEQAGYSAATNCPP